jgi:hypothetical protein
MRCMRWRQKRGTKKAKNKENTRTLVIDDNFSLFAQRSEYANNIYVCKLNCLTWMLSLYNSACKKITHS